MRPHRLPRRRRAAAALVCSVVFGIGLALAAGEPPRRTMADPLDTPVTPPPAAPTAAKGTTSSVVRQGDRLLAVGPRGLILLSTDGSKSWSQVPSPVATDLVTVRFADARTAWAVGHDGVALRSRDGGASWQRVIDGRSLLKLLTTTYDARAKHSEPGAEAVRKEVARALQQSATPDVLPVAFLDVWFADAREGYLVGAFGLLLRTRDGGDSWEPLIERTDNERRYHLYAVGGHGEQRWIAGEQGLLMRWDAAAGRFVKVETPYNGSYFGIDVAARRLVVYGLRGNAYVSEDGGSQWRRIDTGIDANLVALVPWPGGGGADGGQRYLLVSQAGHVLAVNPGSLKAVPLQVPFTAEVFGAAGGKARGLVLAQVNGLRDIEVLGLSAP